VRRGLVRAIGLVPSPLLLNARRLGREALEASTEGPTSAVFALSYGGTRFNLYVGEAASGAQGACSRWAEGTEVYELVMLECLTRVLRSTERPAFMDVGAFTGHYACYAAALLGDREETYAVESNPEYCAYIHRSVQLNGFSKLKPLNAVLSDSVEDAAIEGTAVRFLDTSGNLTQTVTLDELCRREQIKPKVIKIDVHGSEGKVLMGMQEVMRRSVEHILLELHPGERLREYSGQTDWREILSLLWRLDFHVFHLAGHRYRGSEVLRRTLQDGFAYRRLDSQAADLLLFDRPLDVLLLCSRNPDLGDVLGPSVADPGLKPGDW
jgi:FkbM family methyltransferase